MKGRIVSFSVIPRSRKQLLTVEVDGDIGELIDALRDADIDIQLKNGGRNGAGMPTIIYGCFVRSSARR